jgi:hypothetical protein
VQRAKAYAEWLGSRGTLLEAPVPQIRLAGPSVTVPNVAIRNESAAQAEVEPFAHCMGRRLCFLSFSRPSLSGGVLDHAPGLKWP